MTEGAMNCTDREKAISDYLDGGLDARRRRELEEHLETCPSCRDVRKRLEETGRLVREAVSSAGPAPGEWDSRREKIKRNVLDEIGRNGRARRPAGWARLLPRPIPALAAGILLLAAAGIIGRAVFFPPEEEVPAELVPGLVPGPTGKDFSLFRGIQDSFPQRVEWVTVDGREVDFDLGPGEAEPDPDDPAHLLFLAFRIVRGDDGPGDPVISAPRIVVREGAEFDRDFSLPPDPGANYRLRVRPRMTGENRISLALDLVFRRTGPDGPEEARITASPTVVPGEPTLLGSILPGDDYYRVEVLGEIEPRPRSRPGERVL